jgi:hypothetical protein
VRLLCGKESHSSAASRRKRGWYRRVSACLVTASRLDSVGEGGGDCGVDHLQMGISGLHTHRKPGQGEGKMPFTASPPAQQATPLSSEAMKQINRC